MNDDALIFAPEDDRPATHTPEGALPWRVLVVDDEPNVHTVTLLALAGLEVDGRRLVIEHAHSAAQARQKLAAREDWAVVLLDVVMESDDAGLQLVKWLREERANHEARIIVRTGQPGIAPEREVMRSHDIDDYQPKSELSAQRLVTSVLGAIRGWRDLRVIAEQRERIEKLHAEQAELLVAFGRFVPSRMLLALGHASPVGVRLGDHVQRDMTLMFLDVRSFTRLAERLSPAETFALLNDLFGEIVPILHRHGGVVDKFLGDGLLAIFTEDAQQAVQAAYDILTRLDARVAEGSFPNALDIGIGIHGGPTVLGLVGSEERMETTVIADAVNVAARLEHLTREVDSRIVVSEAVYNRLRDGLGEPSRALGAMHVRGRQDTVVCYDLRRVTRA